ncbi:ATP synthase subunit I [Proteocatella sphenisci]|uniref:ATP synthase subunit I n=1 Tax=Proteocatella sphenisci TaxID=181070 RepID=UPI0004916C8B|nr:ATP synthase subunit I [Proteocatella sphenisci]
MLTSFLTGMVLGIIFFGGLNYTIKYITKVKNPVLFVTMSFVLRMAVLLAGFYQLRNSGYMSMVIALIGVITARIAITYFVRNSLMSDDEKLVEEEKS